MSTEIPPLGIITSMTPSRSWAHQCLRDVLRLWWVRFHGPEGGPPVVRMVRVSDSSSSPTYLRRTKGDLVVHYYGHPGRPTGRYYEEDGIAPCPPDRRGRGTGQRFRGDSQVQSDSMGSSERCHGGWMSYRPSLKT